MELLRVDAIDSIVSVVSDIVVVVVVWEEVVTGREMAESCQLVLLVSAPHTLSLVDSGSRERAKLRVQ